MGTISRDPDGRARPQRVPRHAARPFRLLAPRRLAARFRPGPFPITRPFRSGRPFRPTGPASTVGPFSPVAAYGSATPTGLRARRALRLFVTTGVWAAGLLLLAGFIVLAVSAGSPQRTGLLAGASSLAPDGHGAAVGRDGDHRPGRLAQPPAGPRAVGYRSPGGHPVRSGTDGRDHPGGRPSHPARPVASFAGHGDTVTRQFTLSTKANWQILWSYDCPAILPTGLLVVEDAVPGAVGTVVSASGTAGHGDTWLDPDGRSHRLVVMSTCSWTMKVIQN